MIVKNNTGNTKGMQLEGKWHVLLPGVNEVDPKAWEAFISNPAQRFLLESGELEVVEEAKTLADLAKLSVKEAIAMVKETFRKDLLDRWAEAEERKTVLDAIEKQYDALTIKPKKEDAPEGETGDVDGEEDEP